MNKIRPLLIIIIFSFPLFAFEEDNIHNDIANYIITNNLPMEFISNRLIIMNDFETKQKIDFLEYTYLIENNLINNYTNNLDMLIEIIKFAGNIMEDFYRSCKSNMFYYPIIFDSNNDLIHTFLVENNFSIIYGINISCLSENNDVGRIHILIKHLEEIINNIINSIYNRYEIDYPDIIIYDNLDIIKYVAIFSVTLDLCINFLEMEGIIIENKVNYIEITKDIIYTILFE